MIIDSWKSCYPSQWKGMIVPDAFAHPAKFSSKLIRRIYDHTRAEGWTKPGDTIIDPFGGVALGALDAMRLGLKWRGVELEFRFAGLGSANIAFWNNRFRTLPGWCQDAELLCGDSRNLAQILVAADGCVSSPPWGEVLGDTLIDPAERRALADKMEISNSEHVSPIDMEKIGKRIRRGYSGDKIVGIVSSPPYADGCAHNGGDDPHPERLKSKMGNIPGLAGAVSSPPYSEARIGQESGQEQCSRGDQYGATPGQLGAMKANGFDAAISSPPFRQQSGGAHVPKGMEISDPGLAARHAAGNAASKAYGEAVGQLANESDSDFWTSARTIIDQVYQVLAPGGHAVWVCKDFVKDKQRVLFCDQWRQVCEAAGFVTIHEHHALLVHSTEHDFDGNEKRWESKSFFRRLAENKGSPRIDFETVYCMEKP